MKRPVLLLRCLRWLAILLPLVGFSAWLISAHLAPRPFASAFWPCLVGSLLASAFFLTLNILEGGCIGVICLTTCLVGVHVLGRFHPFAAAGYTYIVPAAMLTGFVATRGILYPKFFS